MNENFTDIMLYSKGVYWLFEHWREDGKNIYSKSKYQNKEDFLNGAGRWLTSDEITELKNGKSITIKRDDGTSFFFKFVNNP